MLEVLKALKVARAYVAGQPPLVKSEPGPEGKDGKPDFWYPSEAALRRLASDALEYAGLFEVPEDIRSNGVLKVTWCLYLLEGPGEGQAYRLEMEWPVDVSQSMSRPHASVWSLTHAWRHAMMQLLKVRTTERDATTPGGWATPEQLEREAKSSPEPVVLVSAPALIDLGPEPQWAKAGAVLDDDEVERAPSVEPEIDPPAYDPRSIPEVWVALPDKVRARLNNSLLFSYREFKQDPGARLIPPDDEAFKRHLASFLPAEGA